MELEGRYLKVVDNRCIEHFGVKVGDYLKYSHTDELNHEHWGKEPDHYYYGENAHSKRYFVLMPPGFKPANAEPKYSPAQYPELKGLSEFPSEGVCWQPTKELRKFLTEKYDIQDNTPNSKGVAWGLNSFWGVANSSGKPEYNIKQLEPFLERYKKKDIPENLKPLTPDECFVSIKPGDKVIVDFPGNCIHGIKGVVEKIFIENGISRVEFKRPLPRHPEGGELLATPLTRVKHYSDKCNFPEKWCIQNNPLNHEIIDAFMKEHSKEWKCYTEKWTVEGSHGYFHYPPIGSCFPAHSEDKPQPGYTLITTQQFKNTFLQKNNNLIINEDDRSRSQSRPSEPASGVTIEVQRPDITVRGGDPVRGVGIKCSNFKIEVGSGHLPDKFGLS